MMWIIGAKPLIAVFNHHCDLVAAVSNNVVVLVVSVQVAGG